MWHIVGLAIKVGLTLITLAPALVQLQYMR